MSDLRFAFRQLLKNPGFTLVAVLTLALGIGANSAIFSVINGVLLKPLPYPDPDRLVTLWERDPSRGIEQDRVSGPNYLDWRAQSKSFVDFGLSPAWEGSMEFNLLLRDATTKIQGAYASASLFTTLGTQPLIGRTFLPEEDRKEGPRVAVLSYGLWQRHFGGDSNLIGQTLTVDTYGRREYVIVGVMPPGFGVPSQSELWLPMGWMGVALDERRSAHWHQVIGRLKPAVTLAQGSAEMNGIQARLKQAYPEAVIGSEVSLVPVVEQAVGRNFRLALIILWGVVAGVLLIACANLANLLLARATGRHAEMAVRLALGASRWRIMRQLLVESLVLALLGGGLGVLLGWWGVHVLVVASPANIPRLSAVTLDGSAIAFTLGVSLLTGLLFGLVPAWHGSKADLGEALKDSSRGASEGRSAGHTRALLVVTEVALSLVLLIAAALMLQSFARMLRAPRGFNPTQLLTVELDFSVSGFTTWVRPTATRPQMPLQELIQRLRSYPGVVSVGAGSTLLRRDNHPPSQPFVVYGRPVLQPEKRPTANFKGITPDWLRALGSPILRGRDFTEADHLEAPGVVLINQALASRYFPDEDPIGKHLTMGNGQSTLGTTNVYGGTEWSRIIGVVADVKSLHSQPEAVPEVYSSYWQWPMQSPTLLVRATGDFRTLAAAIRRETRGVIPNLPPPVIRSMDDLVAESVAQPRLQAVLLGLFGVLAVGLAAVGLYGVVALSVGQRTREIGIRIALGARRVDVLTLVVGQGMRLAMVGLGVGFMAAIAFTRVMRNLLYQVKPIDPMTYAGVFLLLAGLALFACWLPARRAARINPTAALRNE